MRVAAGRAVEVVVAGWPVDARVAEAEGCRKRRAAPCQALQHRLDRPLHPAPMVRVAAGWSVEVGVPGWAVDASRMPSVPMLRVLRESWTTLLPVVSRVPCQALQHQLGYWAVGPCPRLCLFLP